MTGDFRDVTVDGWPAQAMNQPPQWYADMHAGTGIEYPVNADETLLRTGLDKE